MVTLLAAALALAGCASLAPEATDANAPAPAASPTTAGVTPQVHRDWAFEEDGLRFDNRLPGARLTSVERLGEGRYRLSVAPETQPINPSPWYGFRITSRVSRTLDLEFTYPDKYRHRYVPKLSVDGGHTWREADAQSLHSDADGRTRLQVQMDAGELRVFAQPPFLPGDFAAWTQRVAAQVGATPRDFGTSVQGRPLQMFEFGAGLEAPLLLVIGRQHPPENTGSQALMGFVETLAADTPQAASFRSKVHVIVAPLLNPDGVVEGNWRSNANGVDINRDWGPFAQPETRAVRDLLAARGNDAGHVVFSIDFHSTFRDVFYTVAEDPSRKPGGLLHDWMASMQARFPGRIEEKAYAATSSVFKNWAFCEFGAPAVTYEVGDTTPAAELGEVSRHAAESLMTLLADPPSRSPVPHCTAARAD